MEADVETTQGRAGDPRSSQRRAAAMMIVLRVVVLILTAILAATGLVLAVVTLLAAQWLLVAAVVLLVLGAVWAVLKGIALIRASCSGTDQERAAERERRPGSRR
jgi:hypothetical protein